MFAWIINGIQSRVFGRAVLNWSDGKTRYEKSRLIFNTIFWVVPLTLVLNTLNIKSLL